MCKDIVKVEKKELDFYRRILFKSGYKRNCTNEELKVLFIDTAWTTMARTLEEKPNCTHFKGNALKNLKQELKNIICNENVFLNDSVEKIILNCLKINDSKIKYLDFHYGQAQKVVNMFFKYLYLFRKEFNIKNKFFEKCDCPIDRNTLRRLKLDLEKVKKFDEAVKINSSGSEVTYDGTVWSRLDKDKYEKIQNLIDDVKGNQTRLEYEFDWE